MKKGALHKNVFNDTQKWNIPNSHYKHDTQKFHTKVLSTKYRRFVYLLSVYVAMLYKVQTNYKTCR